MLSITNINLYYITEFIEWIVNQNFKKINSGKTKILTHHVCHKPWYSSVRVLPKNIKNDILNEIIIPSDMGIIVRTAGSNTTKNEIENDLKNLIKVWDNIKEKATESIAPTLIHQESDIIKRTLRDIYDDETQNIIVDGNDGYQKAKNFMKIF